MSQHSTAFVRRDFIESAPPPPGETGLVHWLRVNLFATIPSSLLTIAAIASVYFLIVGVFPWFYNGIWQADSLGQCQAILEGKTGGCFAVLTERWKQLMFGFAYPESAYWRPVVAFVLLGVALAPVLFSKAVPRKMLGFTAVYPFIMVWLLWGGAFWLPLLILAGFVLMVPIYRVVLNRFTDAVALLSAAAFLVLWLGWGVGIANDSINRVVGAMRMDAQVAALQQQVDLLPGRIAALEQEVETLADAIAGPIAEAEAVGGQTLRTVLSDLAPERKALRDRQRDLAEANSALSENTTLLNRANELPSIEESLPVLRAAAASLRAALPDTVRRVKSPEGLVALRNRNADEGLGIPMADFRAAEAALGAEAAVQTAELSLERTYADIARIGLEPVSSRQFGGFMLNMILGTVCVSLSLPIGILLALGRQSSMPIVKWLCVMFIEFVRGVPLITLLFVANVVLAYFLPPGSNFDLILRVIIMITMFASAYIAEVVRGGLAALPRGQYEAADSLGLDYAQSIQLIILPQALKISIPGIVNVAVGLFKDTTLVSVISMFDLVGMIRGPIFGALEWNGVYWEALGFAALVFFVVCYSISQYSQWLERQLQTDRR
jgi:general L-amino acid transport system permease protein